MANASRINGFKPVKHLNGSPYNGQANIYEVPAGEAVPVFVGDLVKLSDSAGTAGFPWLLPDCRPLRLVPAARIRLRGQTRRP